jgi:hypothetical protein
MNVKFLSQRPIYLGMFKFLLIPCDGSSITELQKSKSGGLENDELRLSAEAHFSSIAIKQTVAEQQSAIDSLLAEKGIDAGTVNPDLLKNIHNLGGSVEILSLLLPSANNGFTSISLYCDRNGQAKYLAQNQRATSLCQSCSLNTVVYGDAFIGRAHDDESLPWERMNFDSTDLSSDAPWLLLAQTTNRGKNMGSYTTSGSLQNMMNQQKQAPAQLNNSKAAAQSSGANKIDTTWHQTTEDIEFSVSIPNHLKASDIDVKIQSSRVQLSLKTPMAADDDTLVRNAIESAVISASGAELYGRIDVSNSTWNVEKLKDGSLVVVFSLSKGDTTSWPQLLK